MNVSLKRIGRYRSTKTQSAASARDGAPLSSPIAKGLLIVDDEPILTDLLSSLVESRGYYAFTAHSGEDALKLYSVYSASIALVITDLHMPGMGGAAMIGEMQRCTPEVKVLVVSGNCSEIDREDLLKRGIFGFLPKPFSITDLMRKIETALTVPCHSERG